MQRVLPPELRTELRPEKERSLARRLLGVFARPVADSQAAPANQASVAARHGAGFGFTGRESAREVGYADLVKKKPSAPVSF